jgi:hypothetical protein
MVKGRGEFVLFVFADYCVSRACQGFFYAEAAGYAFGKAGLPAPEFSPQGYYRTAGKKACDPPSKGLSIVRRI